MKAARSVLVARLGDPTAGFNAAHAAIFASYGLSAAIAVNWTPNAPVASRQLYQSYYRADDVMQFGTPKWPLVFIYGEATQNEDDEKFDRFAGIVQLSIDFYSSFKSENALPSVDDTVDSIEDALVTCVNDQGWTAANSRPVIYKGEISLQRFPVMPQAQNFMQLLRTRMKFGVYQQQ